MKKPIFRLLSVALLSLAMAATTTSCNDDNNPTEQNPSDFVLNRDDLKGNITNGEVVLESGTYRLTGALVVGNGATLRIKPGVVITATELASDTDFSNVRYIVVAQGGKIFVEGTASQPVVMTSDVKVPGEWGGLVICGKAPINVVDGGAGTAQAEVSGLTYGGTEVNDNSGSIKYLRIEYSGYAYNADKEFNGLSMFGVGKGTTIEYVQVHEGSDDGFEWFGGTVDSRYLVVTNFMDEVPDDLFDWTEGWNGVGQYWYGIRTNDGNRGIEADNSSQNHMQTPISNPTISNVTLIGNGVSNQSNSPENQAIKLRVGTKVQFSNVVLKDWQLGLDVQHDESVGYAQDGQIKIDGVRFENVAVQHRAVMTDSNATAPDISGAYTVDANATGAGNGTAKPTWAQGWTVGNF